MKLRSRRPPGRGRERGIFRINPAQKRRPFFGIGADQIHPLRCGRERDCRRINNLKKIKTGRVRPERGDEKTRYREITTARWIPVKQQWRGGRSIYFSGGAANEKEEIPCSGAALGTAHNKF